MVATVVDYTGGRSEAPTYKTVCDGDGHVEALCIEYDPDNVTYETLLGHFFRGHVPFDGRGEPQYRSAIWWHNEAQRDVAWAALRKKKVQPGVVLVEPAKAWHDAEDYHQLWFVDAKRKADEAERERKKKAAEKKAAKLKAQAKARIESKVAEARAEEEKHSVNVDAKQTCVLDRETAETTPDPLLGHKIAVSPCLPVEGEKTDVKCSSAEFQDVRSVAEAAPAVEHAESRAVARDVKFAATVVHEFDTDTATKPSNGETVPPALNAKCWFGSCCQSTRLADDVVAEDSPLAVH